MEFRATFETNSHNRLTFVMTQFGNPLFSKFYVYCLHLCVIINPLAVKLPINAFQLDASNIGF